VIPAEFHDFFLAAAGASGALVGLLFVAISVAPKPAVGESASVMHQIRASSALTALVTPLILALIALIPDTNLGWPAVVIGFSGTVLVATATRRLLGTAEPRRRQLRSLTLLAGFLVVMVINLWAGIRLIRSPYETGPLDWIAGAMIGSLGIGIDRAWELVGARQSGLTTSITDLLGRQSTKPNS
jgi:hypothetical protein